MHDHESPEDKVKRLEAEAEALRKQLADIAADRDKYKDQFRMVAHDLSMKVWEGFTQAELDEAMRNPVTLRSLIDQWKAEEPNG